MAPTDHATLKRSILEVSLQLGTELGEDGLTMRAIARRLGVSATALYQHFDSKGSILRAIRFDGLEKLHAHLAPAFELPAPAERIREHCVRYRSFSADNPWLYNLLVEGEGIPWDKMSPEEHTVVLRSSPAVAAAFNEGKADGSLRSDLDVSLAPLTLWASLHGFACLLQRGHVEADAGGGVLASFVDGLVATFRSRP